MFFFFSSRRRHTRWPRDWSSDVCSSDLFRGKTIHKYCHFFLFESKHGEPVPQTEEGIDRKSTRLNSSHVAISYAVFCLKKKKKKKYKDFNIKNIIRHNTSISSTSKL